MAEKNTEGPAHSNVVPFSAACTRRVPQLTDQEILALRAMIGQACKISTRCPTARQILSED